MALRDRTFVAERMPAALLIAAAVTLGACAGETGAAFSGGASAGADAAAGADAVDDDGAGADGGQAIADDAAPAAPQPPAPYKYTGGACPTLNPGHNAFWSWSFDRTLDLYLPSAGVDKGSSPLLMLWHGLGDSKENFGAAMGAQALANKLGAVVVVPQAKGKFTGWGWGDAKGGDEDGALFDDILSCVDSQFDIDNHRVWTMGFSSGALWSSWLVMHRSTFLASAVLWSGGTGKKENPYATPKRKLPVLMAWGGTSDQAGYSFDETTKAMSSGLLADGHFVVLCNHNGGHTIPSGGLVWALRFLQRHSYGDTGVVSLATDAQAQADYPAYCSFNSP